MTKNKKNKARFTRYELILFVITGLICCAFPFISIFAKSNLSEISYKLESHKDEILGVTLASPNQYAKKIS